MARSFTLGEHFEHFIDAQLKEGRFSNANEIVRAGLRLLEEQAQLHQLRVGDIRRSIEESRRNGATAPADQVFDRIEAKLKGMAS